MGNPSGVYGPGPPPGLPSGGTTGQSIVQGPSGPTWANGALGNSANSTPTGPSGGASVYTMCGLGYTFTPSRSGRVMIVIEGSVSLRSAAAAGDGIYLQLTYGTGAAPGSNGALTGTVVGPAVVGAVAGSAQTGQLQCSFHLAATIPGLTIGTQYWFDLRHANATGNTGNGYGNVMGVFMEQ